MNWVFKVYYFEDSLPRPIVSSTKVGYSGSYKFVMIEAKKLIRDGCVVKCLPDGRTLIVKPISIEVIPDL
jgi:hypothetical protein